ncbi:hypothetical protein J4E85_007650 [Alternaria conjuncta]|uniref:uncharacterized protein n=1 Tax=Alternaria conjuncta TaxID=181017 RepID=UPI00221EF792|nr:uncharacterized protein J4E85_007650 [Alternaria conjuncta]KAI4924534.1 hypothetical protein J4E85_007650 [Alternaria conjuncta]
MAHRPRHVLITGGSRGIGLAIAQLFSKNAYRCTLISRSEPDLKTAIASLTPLPSTSSPETPSNPETHDPAEPPSYQHGYIAGDISLGSNFWHLHPSRPFIAHLPKPERTAFSTHPSRIDVVVNCAGVTQAKLFSGLNEEDLESIVRTNLTSMMLGTKFLLRQAEDKAPVIINVSSLLGLQGGYGAVAYAASKAGVLGFTRALATEYASHKVRVNAIVPGYVETDMTKGTHATVLFVKVCSNHGQT